MGQEFGEEAKGTTHPGSSSDMGRAKFGSDIHDLLAHSYSPLLHPPTPAGCGSRPLGFGTPLPRASLLVRPRSAALELEPNSSRELEQSPLIRDPSRRWRVRRTWIAAIWGTRTDEILSWRDGSAIATTTSVTAEICEGPGTVERKFPVLGVVEISTLWAQRGRAKDGNFVKFGR